MRETPYVVREFFRFDEIVISNPDDTVSIADLAINTPVDCDRLERETRPSGTSSACSIAEMIREDWAWETEAVEADYYNGATINFKDGSVLTLIDRR